MGLLRYHGMAVANLARFAGMAVADLASLGGSAVEPSAPAARSWTIAGAGFAAVNAVVTHTLIGGVDYWVATPYTVRIAHLDSWQIQYLDAGTWRGYYANLAGGTEPPVDGWYGTYGDYPPAPTVTEN